MSVKIRLRRMGATNDPFFRIVAADSRSPNIGRFLETIGWYDPKKPGVNYELKMDRLKYWEANGAEVSDTVSSLAKRVGQDAPVSKKAIKKAAAAEVKAAEAAKAAAEAAAVAEAEAAEAAAKAEAEAAAKAEAEAAAEPAEVPAEEAKAEAAPAEAKEEAAPVEEAKKKAAPVEDAASDEPKADS